MDTNTTIPNIIAPNPLANINNKNKYPRTMKFGCLVNLSFILDRVSALLSTVTIKIDTHNPWPRKTTGLNPPYLSC